MTATRTARRAPALQYGELLAELGRERPAVVVLDCGLGSSMQTGAFAREFPSRYFNLGIAEQNAVGLAAGLAREGFVPLLHSFANFLARRAHDQIAVSVAWPGVPVKFVAGSCGLWDGRNGPSHTGIDDLASVSNMPGMLVAEPADLAQTATLMRAALDHPGPAYLRLRRHGMARDIARQPLTDGVVAARTSPGQPAVTLVAAGSMLGETLYAARILGDSGVAAEVIGVSVLGASLSEVVASGRRSGLVVVIENHAPHGGFADRVSAVLAPHGLAVHRFTLPADFLPAADPDWLLEHCGLSGPHLAARIENILSTRLPEVG